VRSEGREVSPEREAIALALGLCVSALSQLARRARRGSPRGNSSWPQPAPADPPWCLGVVGCCPAGCRGGDTGIMSWLAQQVPPYRQPRVVLSVLKSFFVSLQMLGSLGQRFSICRRLPEQVTLPSACTIPHSLQGSRPRRAGDLVDLSISFFPFAVRPSVTVAGRLQPRSVLWSWRWCSAVPQKAWQNLRSG